MPENEVPYIITHGDRNGKKHRDTDARSGAGILILSLVILTALICLLVIFLPESGSNEVSGVAGRTFYALATQRTGSASEASGRAQVCASMGGAGYIYNDGEYHIVAAVYSNKDDAQKLVAANDGSHMLEVHVPALQMQGGDAAAMRFLTGEWFESMLSVTNRLDSGEISEAEAEFEGEILCRKLSRLADAAEDARIKKCAVFAGAVSGASPLSSLRYTVASGIFALAREFEEY